MITHGSGRTGAGGGPGGISALSRRGERHTRPEPPLRGRGKQGLLQLSGDQFVFQLTGPNMAIAGMVVKPWGERKDRSGRSCRRSRPSWPGSRAPVFLAPPAPLRAEDNFPVEFVIASTADATQILPFAQKICRRGRKERHVRLSAAVDVQDRPAAVGVRHRPRQGRGTGPQPGAGRRRPLAPWAGNYVNCFDISGRSYKVIPQVKRVGRLNAGPAQEHLCDRTERAS